MKEFVHYEKRHYLIKYLIQILKVIWWFHPGIWILENEISRLETEQQDEKNLSDYVKLAEIGENLEKLQTQLETAYKEWESLAE